MLRRYSPVPFRVFRGHNPRLPLRVFRVFSGQTHAARSLDGPLGMFYLLPVWRGRGNCRLPGPFFRAT